MNASYCRGPSVTVYGAHAVVRVAVVSAEAPPALRGAADVVVDGPGELLGLLRLL